MKVRFLADANFNQKIVAGLLLREPGIDFALLREQEYREREDGEKRRRDAGYQIDAERDRAHQE